MENEQIVDGGLARFRAILREEESGDDSELQIDDADLVDFDAIEVPSEPPVVAPVASPVSAQVVAPPVTTPKRVLTLVWKDGEAVAWSDGQKIGRGKKPRKVST